MDLDALTDSPVGQLVPINGYDTRRGREYDYYAFLPDTLPDVVDLAQSTWILVNQASSALARLDQAGVLIPNPGLIRGPLLRREAISTSALEGTYAAFADVLEADVAQDSPQTPEVREVRNYVLAAEHAIASIFNGRPISVSLLREVHKRLMKGTRGEGPESGQVRTTQVLIGPEDSPVVDARFVPPPGDDRLTTGIDAWSAWVNGDRDLPIVIQAALAHYQFETLHPFHDGNGRIGRLVVLLQLMRSGELREPLLEVSPWFESRRRPYQDHLLVVSQTGNWDPWVSFFCSAIRDQAQDTVQRINRLLNFQTNLRDELRRHNVKGVAVNIAEELIGQPILTVPYASHRHGVTYPAANQAIRRLTNLGVLEEATGRTYGRIFRSKAVFELLE